LVSFLYHRGLFPFPPPPHSSLPQGRLVDLLCPDPHPHRSPFPHDLHTELLSPSPFDPHQPRLSWPRNVRLAACCPRSKWLICRGFNPKAGPQAVHGLVVCTLPRICPSSYVDAICWKRVRILAFVVPCMFSSPLFPLGVWSRRSV